MPIIICCIIFYKSKHLHFVYIAIALLEIMFRFETRKFVLNLDFSWRMHFFAASVLQTVSIILSAIRKYFVSVLRDSTLRPDGGYVNWLKKRCSSAKMLLGAKFPEFFELQKIYGIISLICNSAVSICSPHLALKVYNKHGKSVTQTWPEMRSEHFLCS